MSYFWFISFYYLGVLNDYKKENGSATNKINFTTIITETTKTATTENSNKINESRYIALSVVSRSIKQLFSIDCAIGTYDCVNIGISQSIVDFFFYIISLDFKVWGYAKLLISWFINSLDLKVIFIKRIIHVIYIIVLKYVIYLFIICILGKEYTLISSLPENILIFIIWLMLRLQRNTLYSLEAPVTAYKRLKTITGFNNTTVNKWTEKDLASWMFKIVSLFAYLQPDCRKAREHWASEFLDVSGTVELGR